jgi:hypothetical protein
MKFVRYILGKAKYCLLFIKWNFKHCFLFKCYGSPDIKKFITNFTSNGAYQNIRTSFIHSSLLLGFITLTVSMESGVK